MVDEIKIDQMSSLQHGMCSMRLLGLISRPAQGEIEIFILLVDY